MHVFGAVSARGCGDRRQLNQYIATAYPPAPTACRRPVIGAGSARRSPGQPARGSTKTQRGGNGLGYERDVNRELRDSTYDQSEGADEDRRQQEDRREDELRR